MSTGCIGNGEKSRGLRCPHCGAYGTLRVKWTRVKGDSLRRDVFFCQACGEPAAGWLCLDAASGAAPVPPAASAASAPQA